MIMRYVSALIALVAAVAAQGARAIELKFAPPDFETEYATVSYTHLTLPTSDLV